MPPLEHQHPASRARKISRVDQAVVAAADDDDIVFAFICHVGLLRLLEDSVIL